MPRNIDSAITTYLATGAPYYLAFLVKIEFPSPYELLFTSLLDNYDYNGDTYIGLGSLGSVSMPRGDGELSPKEYNIKLSGISDDVLQAATQIEYLNNKATCWMVFFDEDMNQLGTPMIAWRGLTDQIEVTYGETSYVSINIRDRLVDWERPKVERYNDGDQQASFPNDKFFEFVAELSTKDAPWPEAAWFKANVE